MGTVRKTITVTEKQDDWIKEQISKGDFTNESEYIRSLIRREQRNNSQFLNLKSKIDKGLESGLSSKTVEEIWNAGKKRFEENQKRENA
ncbi:type II toxin-antitoxin system ParD family antitoxin [Leeuwenhoekiella nanhaiensis]|uniref:Addiction module antitoxin n=1 Tax=Leeuwenhoekiella nanhaiensis TaxID=1655491 RepID=A0A2G1VX04_9FLAO|nr:type II toxin-antitoxin system ParD family antitoxin [Leeuwenhoekiella nanhaiensis]PHQ30959.1 addiction module antitoxin [Leeuwenhoekiella nanhaiensis]